MKITTCDCADVKLLWFCGQMLLVVISHPFIPFGVYPCLIELQLTTAVVRGDAQMMMMGGPNVRKEFVQGVINSVFD